MDYKIAKKLLPSWAKGLAEGTNTVAELRSVVKLELFNWRAGVNPKKQRYKTKN